MITVHNADFEKICSFDCPFIEIEFIKDEPPKDDWDQVVPITYIKERCKYVDVCRNAIDRFNKRMENEVENK